MTTDELAHQIAQFSVGWVCQHEDGKAIHRRGIYHVGDDPLIPLTKVMELIAEAEARGRREATPPIPGRGPGNW